MGETDVICEFKECVYYLKTQDLVSPNGLCGRSWISIPEDYDDLGNAVPRCSNFEEKNT